MVPHGGALGAGQPDRDRASTARSARRKDHDARRDRHRARRGPLRRRRAVRPRAAPAVPRVSPGRRPLLRPARAGQLVVPRRRGRPRAARARRGRRVSRVHQRLPPPRRARRRGMRTRHALRLPMALVDLRRPRPPGRTAGSILVRIAAARAALADAPARARAPWAAARAADARAQLRSRGRAARDRAADRIVRTRIAPPRRHARDARGRELEAHRRHGHGGLPRRVPAQGNGRPAQHRQHADVRDVRPAPEDGDPRAVDPVATRPARARVGRSDAALPTRAQPVPVHRSRDRQRAGRAHARRARQPRRRDAVPILHLQLAVPRHRAGSESRPARVRGSLSRGVERRLPRRGAGTEELRSRARAQRAGRAQRDRAPGAAPKLRRAARILIAPTPAIEGHCDARFVGLREAFAANFSEQGEVGAGLCIEIGGARVVDLWGGHRDVARTRLWREDTLVNAFSVGKGVVAMLALVLIERGDLSLDAPVARYWPEFGAAGKHAITVRALLAHRAGLPAIRERLPDEALYEWDRICAALASQAPYWTPGTAHGYHVNTYGFLAGELIRRVTQLGVGEALAQIV